jgi:pimeloyl-ACP methyl ester carboxylesterase
LHFKDAMAVELPGHPDGTGCGSIEEYVASVEDYVEKKAVKNLILVGHSMGGAIAITFALRHPDMAGIVLVGTGARLRVQPQILSKIKENYEEASKLIASWSISPTSGPVLADRIAREMLQVNPKVTYGDFMACNKFDRMKDVSKIACKTLIIVGADDQMTPAKYSEYLHEQIAGSRIVVMPGAGHSVMLEKHRAFNEALRAFLDSL